MLESVEWGEFKLGDLFEIQNTLSFNKDKLTLGTDYDYVTRTSQNQGILQTTGFVNQENINSAGNWSLGLLQMDFFYREKPWYAGQFVRKIIPKIKLDKNSILFFTVLLNKQKKNLLSGLVRDVDTVFLNSIVQLPIKNKEIDFDFINRFIAELEAEHIAELEAYLASTNLKDYNLTPEEEKVLKDFETGKMQFDNFELSDLFNIQNTLSFNKDKLTLGIDYDYVTRTSQNQGILQTTGFVNQENINSAGNWSLGLLQMDFFYREKPWYAGQFVRKIIPKIKLDKNSILFFTVLLNKQKKNLLSGLVRDVDTVFLNSIVQLPIKNKKIDYKTIEIFISAIQKLVIKDVVLYADSKITTTKKVVSSKYDI